MVIFKFDSQVSFPLTALPLRRAKISFSPLTQSPNYNASICYSINSSPSQILTDINKSVRAASISVDECDLDARRQLPGSRSTAARKLVF